MTNFFCSRINTSESIKSKSWLQWWTSLLFRLPDELLRNLRASKSVDRRISTCWKSSRMQNERTAITIDILIPIAITHSYCLFQIDIVFDNRGWCGCVGVAVLVWLCWCGWIKVHVLRNIIWPFFVAVMLWCNDFSDIFHISQSVKKALMCIFEQLTFHLGRRLTIHFI